MEEEDEEEGWGVWGAVSQRVHLQVDASSFRVRVCVKFGWRRLQVDVFEMVFRLKTRWWKDKERERERRKERENKPFSALALILEQLPGEIPEI